VVTLYGLMGYTKREYLKHLNEVAYLRKHGLSTKAQDLKRKNVEFSRKFYDIIDIDGQGGVSDQELAYPLIALGLATDMGFVQKVMRILAPNKFMTMADFKNKQLSLKEFSNLMASDAVGDRIVNKIRAEILQERAAKAHAEKQKDL